MNFANYILIILGLCLFEVVSSVDNAVINAEVLSTMSRRARRWFLLWGMLAAVFVMRGLLPWVIIKLAVPDLGWWGSLTMAFSSDPSLAVAVGKSSPMLLLGGGVFLLFLFFHWLFLENKNLGLRRTERFFQSQGPWFYAVISVLLTTIVWWALKIDNLLAFGAVVGSTAFFITHGCKEFAGQSEEKLLSKGGALSRSDISKLLYLEVIDATFSIDGVLGAFAFTLSVPLIIIGNGLGALVIRWLTVGNLENIKKLKYLKNGAMYSILFLGLVMVADSFGSTIPSYLSPLVTFAITGYFYWKSRRATGV